jgi:phosphoribosylformimino-5-aminoimidazole carboxamide ribotide isomerase
MRIIAAIDLIDGECVRLIQGDYDKKRTYDRDPLKVARQLEDHGIKYLHLVDLDGARTKKIVNYNVLESIAGSTSLRIDFSGGIRSDDDLKRAFDSGASQVTCGTVAVAYPPLFLEWMRAWGPEKIILSADFRNRNIATVGWTEKSEIDIITFLKTYRAEGVIYTVCTDIEKDGMLMGPSLDIYREIVTITGLKLIASGGITTADDINKLKDTGCEGAIIGRALYEGNITLKELKELCLRNE